MLALQRPTTRLELHLPLFTVVLEGLITRFPGETAAKLRLVFEFMARTFGVCLFDEFDAIGGQRALANDAREIRRVLSSFLQLFEQPLARRKAIAPSWLSV